MIKSMNNVWRYFLRIRSGWGRPKQVQFVAPDRETYKKIVKEVIEQNKEALEALRDR
jgi:hypothetical protein